MKNAYENFKFWEAANLLPATLLILFRSIFAYENFKFWEAANLQPATLLILFRSIFAYKNFKFWEAANLQPATLLILFRSIFQGFCLLFRNTYFKEYLWVTTSAYSTPMHAFYAWMPSPLVWYSAKFCKPCVSSQYF